MRASRGGRVGAVPLLAGLAGMALTLVVSACSAAAPDATLPTAAPPGLAAERFPRPQRPVAGIVSDQWTSEDSRERSGEAARVMDLLGIRPGMAVADIGAGAGYYVRRLSHRVGPEGRVIAQDVERSTLRRLGQRVSRERLGNVSLVLGEPHDPRLAPGSVAGWRSSMWTAQLSHMAPLARCCPANLRLWATGRWHGTGWRGGPSTSPCSNLPRSRPSSSALPRAAGGRPPPRAR